MDKRRKKRPEKKINYVMRKKLILLFAIVIGAFFALAMRITYINATSGNKYKKQVLSQAQQKYESRVMPAKRGDIYDRNGNILATSNKVYNVILDCKAVNENEDYVEPTVRALTSVLGIEEGEIRTRLTAESTKNSQYQIIKKQISMDDKKAFEDYKSIPEESDLSKEQIQEKNNVQGVWFEEDYLRIYPYNESACDTIGFTLERDVADSGIEGYYNSTLNGVDGRQYGYFNSSSDVEQTIIEPSNGNSLDLSLDMGAQQIVEKYVNAFNERMGAKNVGVIVEDPSNGEIIAMDGGDRYDLNEPRDLSQLYTK
ncbi:MAG: cell division protein FtsI, partial [Blautia sp.]|nr:cell division protein FtsI [Blautia sp.]